MTYQYEDYGRPVNLDRERHNISMRKFHALGAFQIRDLKDPGILIKEACELADTNDQADFKKALEFYTANTHRWDLGDFEHAYCPDCKQIVEVGYYQLGDEDYSVECPECSFVFKD
jgi:hypothetical protein